MSFSPLPEPLLAMAGPMASRPGFLALDLGCGTGLLGQELAAQGMECLGLDRTRPSLGSAADIVGEALQPPLLTGKVDLIVAANLARHLLVEQAQADFLLTWYGLLKPGGSIFILEDHPRAANQAQKNYRDLQEFLKLVNPVRGELLAPEAFLNLRGARDLGQDWQRGEFLNAWPAGVDSILKMLAGTSGSPGPQAGNLIASIQAEGLSYGYYWWASCTRPLL